MSPTWIWLLIGLSLLTAGFYLLATVYTIRRVRRPALPPPATFPPVSLVKPMKGADESLAANLESHFAQLYPAPFEIIFATTDLNDPAVAVAREVAARHPLVPVTFVHPHPDAGLNPKVANLMGALPAAQHDLVFQTDANVRIGPGHLAHIVSEFIAQDPGLLSSIVAGTGERSLGAMLGNLHLTVIIAPSVCFTSDCARRACVVGQALLYRKSELRALGGIEQFKDVLAEDYLMGECYERAGKRVLLSSKAVENVNGRVSVSGFLSRHSRWLKMNAVMHKPAFLLRFLVSPVWALALLAVGFRSALTLAVALGTLVVFLACAQALFRTLRHQWMGLWMMLLSLVDAVLIWGVWFYSAFSRSINWRGKQLVLGRRTVLSAR